MSDTLASHARPPQVEAVCRDALSLLVFHIYVTLTLLRPERLPFVQERTQRTDLPPVRDSGEECGSVCRDSDDHCDGVRPHGLRSRQVSSCSFLRAESDIVSNRGLTAREFQTDSIHRGREHQGQLLHKFVWEKRHPLLS